MPHKDKQKGRECQHRSYLRRKIEYKKLVYDHYGWKCKCCGETIPEFLSVDHINNDGSKELDKKGYRYKSMPLHRKIIKENFPDKYQILCMNCNFGKAINNGICPHKNK